MKVNQALAVFVTIAAFAAGAAAQPFKGVTLLLMDKGFESPLYFIADPAGRNFLVEQNGLVRLLVDGRALRKPYLDITDRVFQQGECGLLSIAFHPRFTDNGRMFVNYTRKQGRRTETVISEFHAEPRADMIDKGTEKIILTIDQPWNNHNGGLNLFGPDGMLYIGMGDGGRGGDPRNAAQNKKSLLGKMLRIDVNGEPGTYAIPKDNPFVGNSQYAPEIWALGLRNPWRFSFDRKTGICYAGDVGQNKYEEIDIITRGGNYGWRVREGMHPFNEKDPTPAGPLIDPIAEYGRKEGISVTGGYVYRGKAHPQWQGIYFYGDFSSARIWGLKYDPKTQKVTWKQEFPVTINRRTGPNQLGLSSFGEDKDGELYITDHAGRLYLMTPTK